jgi:hypothetical protein
LVFTLSSKLHMMDFVPSKGDTSLFFLRVNAVMMYVLIYVDDIIVASSSPEATTALLETWKRSLLLKIFTIFWHKSNKNVAGNHVKSMKVF